MKNLTITANKIYLPYEGYKFDITDGGRTVHITTYTLGDDSRTKVSFTSGMLHREYEMGEAEHEAIIFSDVVVATDIATRILKADDALDLGDWLNRSDEIFETAMRDAYNATEGISVDAAGIRELELKRDECRSKACGPGEKYWANRASAFDDALEIIRKASRGEAV